MNAESMVMEPGYESVIGLEVHAELQTRTKMFCACPVVDSTVAAANTATCPVCAGMPGVLPVANQRAIEFALCVALALNCEIAHTSLFARKNYFYPDLPKGYQISQYEQPLARAGYLLVLMPQGLRRMPQGLRRMPQGLHRMPQGLRRMPQGLRRIRIRRVHIEEDTAKLTHVNRQGENFSLIDLNRAGVPLLEIVTEPDMRQPEEVRAFCTTLRSVLRYLGVNSGDMQKGVLRIEPNVSIRPAGSSKLGTRVEIKNLNSFRALERSVAYETHRQEEILRRGEQVKQVTVGWDAAREETFIQRVKEGEDDYRYFPEPDLPPLVIEDEWIEKVRTSLPELPLSKYLRFQKQYGLNDYDAGVLTAESAVAEYFEKAVRSAPDIAPKSLANWISGELFSLMNQAGIEIDTLRVSPEALVELVQMVYHAEINTSTAKTVLAEMFSMGKSAAEVVTERGLRQISDVGAVAGWVKQVLAQNPEQVQAYQNGKEAIFGWLFGQIMRLTGGQANPALVREELEKQLKARR